MDPRLTVIRADQRGAELRQSAERSRRAREVPGRHRRRSGLRPSLALRIPAAQIDPRTAR